MSRAPGGQVRRVALTGGIATGKSYVLKRLALLGAPTIDADLLARLVVEPDQPALAAIRARFGATVIGADGRLDRTRLGALVFDDRRARADLEAIVHPPVRAAIDDWFRRLPADDAPAFAVACIPLLFETGRAAEFERVIVTTCSPAAQLARLDARDGISAADGRKRLAAQLPDSVKLAGADHVIRTDGSFGETDRQVERVYDALATAAD